MNTFQLIDYMQNSNTSNIFKGVFPSDKLPNSFSLPAGFIINLSPSTSEGSHWVAIYIDRFQRCEYFDSFALPLNNKQIQEFINKHSKSQYFSDVQLQHLRSNKCGKFAAVFLNYRMRNKSLFDYLFSKNLMINEKLIEEYYNYFKK
jgi:hypothetical protein